MASVVISLPAAESEAERFLRQAVERLDGQDMTMDDLRHLVQVAGDDQGLRVVAIQARFQREINDNPVAALSHVWPHLLGPQVAREWQRASTQAQRQSQRDWRQSRRAARQDGRPEPLEPDESRVHAPIPSPDEWQINENTAYLVVEAVRALAALQHYALVQEVCRTMGEGWDYGLPRMLAAEVYADVLAQMGRTEAALESYAFARTVADQSVDAGMTPGAEVAYVAKRIRDSQRRLQRLQDMPEVAQWYAPPESGWGAVLADANQAVAEGTLTEAQWQQLGLLAEKGPENWRPAASAVMATLHRRIKEPAQGLRLLAPLVLKTPLSAEVASDAAVWPDLAHWRLADADPRAVVAAALCLVDLGRASLAVPVLEQLQSQTKLVPHIQTVEAGARLHLAARRFDQAIDGFQYNLDLLPWLLITPTGHQQIDSSGEIARLRTANRAGLEEAKRLREADRYGPGFVAYRNAERLRREEQRPIAALFAYEDLIAEHGESIYAEAARAYRIHGLLALDTADGQEDWQAAHDRLASERDQQREALTAARAAGVMPALLEQQRQQLAHIDDELATINNLPRGAAARSAAHTAVEALMTDNPLGFYRGEALNALAQHLLYQVMDRRAAAEYARRSWDWIEEVTAADTSLTQLTVPGRAQEVTRSPQRTFEVDAWGNIDRASIPIGALVNRRESPWYLDQLRATAARHLGIISYVENDMEAANTWNQRVREFDQRVQVFARGGLWNDAKRFQWAIDNGHIYAHPEDLQHYRGRQRTAVILGDFLFINEHYAESHQLFTRLLDGDFGNLSPAGEHYVRYVIGINHNRLGKRDEAMEQFFSVVDSPVGTHAQQRATFVLGKMLVAKPYERNTDQEAHERGMSILHDLATTRAASRWVMSARVNLVDYWVTQGDHDRARGYLRMIPENSKPFRAIGEYIIQEYGKESP